MDNYQGGLYDLQGEAEGSGLCLMWIRLQGDPTAACNYLEGSSKEDGVKHGLVLADDVTIQMPVFSMGGSHWIL